jgi:ClpP class serine protease
MKYARVLSRLINTPLAISQSKLDVITSSVSIKLLAGQEIDSPVDLAPTNKPNIASVGVINVFDSLASKNGAGLSGCTTYSDITSQIQYLVSNGVSTIYFYIDSPGGEVAGLFGLASFISSLPEKYGVDTVAITDGSMTSAAYVIGAACKKVLATSSSIIASIGVIMTLANVVEADKQDGISYTILRSKSDKALLNPHEAFPQKAIDDALNMLSTLDNIMNNAILSTRPNVSLDTIMKLAGGTVLAEEALSLGLIDGIVESFDHAVTSNTNPKPQPIGTTMAMTLEDALVQLSTVQSELVALKASANLDIAKARLEEQNRILGILDASDTFKIPTASAVKFIKTNTSVDIALMSFEAIREASQAASHVDTTTATTVASVTASDVTTAATSGFGATLLAGLDAMQTQPQLFAGVR